MAETKPFVVGSCLVSLVEDVDYEPMVTQVTETHYTLADENCDMVLVMEKSKAETDYAEVDRFGQHVDEFDDTHIDLEATRIWAEQWLTEHPGWEV